MSEEQKKEPSALEQLKELQEKDSISSLNIKEPDLKGFDASSVFEIDETQSAPKHKIFSKRSARRAQVKVKASAFENEDVEVEDIYVSNTMKRSERLKRSQKMMKSDPEAEQINEEVIVEKPVEETPVAEKTQEINQEYEEPVIQEPSEDETVTVEVEEEPLETESEPEFKEETVSEISETDENAIETSLEDENQYDEEDLYVEKKHFLLSNYDKEEEYLENHSLEGFHYVRNVGKKYFFVKEEPKHYYYSICFFEVEPSAPEWRKWEADGWKLVSRVPAKKKQDAGWFVFRNELGDDDLKKEIPNEAEKFKFFKKYSNSCRSTMFLFFICMAICAAAAYLQYLFNGFIAVIAICGVLFLISFIFFCMYGRMLASSKKKVRLLKARLRVREREETFINEGLVDPTTTEEELDSKWEALNDEDEFEEEEEEDTFELEDEEEEEEPKKRRFGRRRK